MDDSFPAESGAQTSTGAGRRLSPAPPPENPRSASRPRS